MIPSVAEASGERVAGTQSIRRAFAALDLFRVSGGDLGVVEIAERLGLSLSTGHRIARALVAEGYLTQGEGRERYRLGLQSLLLGQAAQRSMGMGVARPVLQSVVDRTQESVNLGLTGIDHVVVVQRIESPQPLRFSVEVGTQVELHGTSMGKAVLAFNDELRQQFSGNAPLVQLTAKTHRDTTSLFADLERIQNRGWSTDDEESVLGVRCVAAPILDGYGQARGALAVQAPAVRMPDQRFDELGREVQLAGQELTRILPL
jgi:IclR family acetate operon transcriptional repressor